MKQSGILLHISSLCTDYGIGDLGNSAYRFADYLCNEGHKFWQILPLNYPGFGNSPYNPISAYASNPYLISPELLYMEGLLSKSELYSLPRSSIVDYQSVYTEKNLIFAKAMPRYLEKHNILEYIDNEAIYLKPYLTYIWLTDIYKNVSWQKWAPEHRIYSEELYNACKNEVKVQNAAALQMVFNKQMQDLKNYLKQKGILLFGDLPLYLSYESAEVWANQHLFDLDENGLRKSVAGVPPDAFAEGGQLWGNPIYLWDKLQENQFDLFMQRIRLSLKYFDLLRLDHFIGYVNYWQVQCPNRTLPENAIHGVWKKALPEAFFATIKQEFDLKHFVAEDLGILNHDVCAIRDSLALPGMIVLQFCFEESVPNVQNYPADRIIYTGTHDNNTTRGWWENLPQESESRENMIEFCRRFFPDREVTNSNIARLLIDIANLSACSRMIYPMQDILGLGAKSRMNIPGTALGNWQWRMDSIP
ncbi:MAG: 4-alpha-glucanotransferase [Candidatus Cloacimonetes bacterium]|nr:4-alpha-glucanotransferase [Candidatus Cloacimonadota bacterium]